MNLVIDTVNNHLPPKRKATPSGWISFNAVCCHHNGTSADKRQRGGIMLNEGVSYHCFNCGFKCSWQPGRHISQKMNKFMRDLNMPDDVISQLRLEALRLNETDAVSVRSIVPTFDKRALPIDAKSFEEWRTFLKQSDDNYIVPKAVIDAVEYMARRNFGIFDYPLYHSDKIGFNNRIIIPFLYKGEVVGWTARAINDAKPKYLSEQQPGYVFNLDAQHDDREFVIISEGPFDALSINGCALLIIFSWSYSSSGS
jgi:hypothetical protein